MTEKKSLPSTRRRKWKKILEYKQLYFLLLPAVIYIAIFCYQPMYGLVMAFKNFSPLDGIWGSPWAGLNHFQRFVTSPVFFDILKNTLTLSIYSLVAGFPLPIVLAFALHYTRNKYFKKTVQTITYAPHFLSVVVICSLCLILFSPRTGIVNTAIEKLGNERIFFMAEPKYFKHIYVWSGIWQNCGWNSIIYMAALAGIDQSIHESAMIDGANQLQRMWYIDFMGILPTIVVLLILNTGSIMSVGYEKVLLLQNSLNAEASEVISTYVYKKGVVGGEYSFSTAVGLFNSLINFILLFSVNMISRKLNDVSLW
ncbi:MAG: sugar ABC transporter permease [Clostridia bacterium]|nr:sugar ABC transporter permease [Clostridia bacterium]